MFWFITHWVIVYVTLCMYVFLGGGVCESSFFFFKKSSLTIGFALGHIITLTLNL